MPGQGCLKGLSADVSSLELKSEPNAESQLLALQAEACKAFRIPGVGRQEKTILLLKDRGVRESIAGSPGHLVRKAQSLCAQI